MCPDWGSNLQPWHIGTVFKPTELLGQGEKTLFKIEIKQSEIIPQMHSIHMKKGITSPEGTEET